MEFVKKIKLKIVKKFKMKIQIAVYLLKSVLLAKKGI